MSVLSGGVLGDAVTWQPARRVRRTAGWEIHASMQTDPTALRPARPAPTRPSPDFDPRRLARLLRGVGEDGLGSTHPLLTALTGLGASLADARALDERRSQLLAAILEVAGAERGFLVRYESPERWEVLASRSLDGEEILNPRDKIILPLVGVARERLAGYSSADLAEEEIHEQLVRARQPRTRSLLILPLPAGEELLYLDNRFAPLNLEPERGPELAWLFATLIAASGMLRAAAEREALESEVKEARRELRQRRSRTGTGHELREDPASPMGPDPRGFAGDFGEVIGRSPDLLEVLEVIEKVAPTTAPILIHGESGTGKELVARAIHRNSDRATGPFVSENCAALTETLLESELFGYVKGSFTGAAEDRPGLFELATGGTLFLDEVGDTSPGMQKKLLRALQEGVIRRVGGSDVIRVDVRIISATNKDLMSEVRAGRFREDLFYRLNVINILLPPLRERREDIPLLLEHFLDRLNQENGLAKRAPPQFLEALASYAWPGNIRELQNEVRRVYALSDETLEPHLLSTRVQEATPGAGPSAALGLEEVIGLGGLKEAMEALEKQVLAASLRRAQGNKARVCEELKIPKTTLYAKLKRYALDDA